MLNFVTLGPSGSNHFHVLRRYLHLHGLTDAARTVLVDDFHAGAAVIGEGADYLLQCAAHPDFAEVTGRYRHQMVPVDAFVAPSQPMSLVRLRGARSPGIVAVQPATREYADLSGFSRVELLPTVSAVQDALLAGRFDAGIVFSAALDAHADRFELVQDLGSVCDAWVLFGRQAVDAGEPVVWRHSPVARQFTQHAPFRSG